MYKKVSTDLKFVEREHEVLKFWEEKDIFKRSIDDKKDCPVYTFYDGPPTANGKPHIGHVLTRAIKDIIPRYRGMKGYNVLRKAGWDTHGLPVELEVEKKLGLDGKDQIEEYGLEPFIAECKKSVWQYKGMWEDFSGKVAFWADMEDPYVTYHNDYIESIWWSLKTIWNKGLLYKGHKIVPYCPRCGTPLSSHEVAQGYKDVKEKSIIVKMKVKGKDNEFILVWTTTPWTLPSNVAVCMNPNETYVKVAKNDEVYYLAEALVDSVLGENYEILESNKGKDLEYMAYEPLFNFVSPEEKAWYVTCDDYVTLSDGTGVVHIAPAFGEDDSKVGKNYGLPFVQLVDEAGCFRNEAVPYKGVFVKEADKSIIEDLDIAGRLFKILDFEHNYPHCWRCTTPLLYYAKDAWYIEMTKVRDNLVANNTKINWLPKALGEKRFGDWIKNVIDWGISRDRYWGTPLPIWECSCGHRHAIGSIAELKEMSNNCPDDIELHRPFIDDVLITCPKCSSDMKRVENVIDCWYDSGAMPFAQWHYPFENKEMFEKHFPADFISEAVDQTRGWFYSLLAISTLLFDAESFKNVIVMGLVQDENGQKMSKSKGNAVDPFDALDTYGADAIRWYFYTNSAPWLPSRFSGDAVTEGQRKFMGTLWNTYAFYVLYADIDKFNPYDYKLEYSKLSLMDQWLLSRLNSVVKKVDDYLDRYYITEGAKFLQEFTDEMSNWYVRRCRQRYWVKEMPQDKINAYMTLHTALVTLAKVSAPFIPFMSEQIYQNIAVGLNKDLPESIHLSYFPEVMEDYINEDLEKNMDEVLRVVVLGRSCRNNANIKTRQPIGKMYVNLQSRLPENYMNIISEELNVKNVEIADNTQGFTTYKFKPQLRTVGPKYGKLLGKIRPALDGLDGNAAMAELDAGNPIAFDFDGAKVELFTEDVLIENSQMEGYMAETDRDITVVLDTNLTEELLEEGYVREIVSKVQTMRKEAGFEVVDHIKLYHVGNEKLSELIKKNADEITDEVLANGITEGGLKGYEKEWNINGEKLKLSVEKV